jgi:hypothetical protein
MLETRVLAGVDINVNDHVILNPFVGGGYRYLNDDSSKMVTDTGALGYEREANYLYSPVGVQAIFAAGSPWTARVSAEYDFFWDGTQKSHLSDAHPSLSDVDNDQDDGHGMRVSAGLQYKGESHIWWAEGFFRFWDIEDSDLQPVTFSGTLIGEGFEPANETYEFGAAIGIRF